MTATTGDPSRQPIDEAVGVLDRAPVHRGADAIVAAPRPQPPFPSPRYKRVLPSQGLR